MRKTVRQVLVLLALSSALGGVVWAAVTEAPAPQVQTAPPLAAAPVQPGKPAWLTPEKEAALVEVRKILREARQVAEGIDAPNTPREKIRPGVPLSPEEENKRRLLHAIEYVQFRAGDFSTGATTTVLASLAFAQLHYGQLDDALKSVARAKLWEEGALSFVYGLAQAKYIDAAIEVAEAQIRKEPINPRRKEAALFALIAREQAHSGDSRVRESIQRALTAAKSVMVPNDRALALIHVARAQREIGDRASSNETLAEALDTAMNAPRGRDTGVLSIIATVQEENGDRIGSGKTLQQILDDEKDLKPMDKARQLAYRACARILRGHRESGTEIFQTALKVVDGLPANEQIRAWYATGKWLIKAGEHKAVKELVQRLVDAAKTSSDEQVRAEALSFASVFAAQVGDLTLALDIASAMKDGWEKAGAMRFIAEQLAKTKNAPNAASLIRRLSDAARSLSQSQLPEDKSQADGMLANIGKIQAVTGDVLLAVQTLKRISGQDYHQGSVAYPQIVKLLVQQGNRPGAREIIDNVERKSLKEVLMAEALQSLGSAYAEAGKIQAGLVWARQVAVEYAKASILLGVAEGIMNRHGLERIEVERPEVMLQRWCSIG